MERRAPAGALALLTLLPQHAAHRPPLGGRGILHEAVGVASLVSFGQVLGDRHALGRDEQQAVAVLVLLHLVAGADPAAELGLRGRIRVEVAWAERTAHLLDVPRQP